MLCPIDSFILHMNVKWDLQNIPMFGKYQKCPLCITQSSLFETLRVSLSMIPWLKPWSLVHTCMKSWWMKIWSKNNNLIIQDPNDVKPKLPKLCS